MATRHARLMGYALRGAVAAIMLADFAVTCFKPEIIRADMEKSGFPMTLATPLGLVELGCGLLYAVAATAPVGAVLITGFLGGAICTHFRLGDIGSPPQLISVGIGIMVWGGLWLRDDRVRALLPVVRRPDRQ